MKALTLTQPWATLVAIGAKRIETRNWSTGYRGELAIHAAKGFPRRARDCCNLTFFSRVLEQVPGVDYRANPPQHWYHVHQPTYRGGLPLGAIVAVARLAFVVSTEHHTLDPRWPLTETERAFGDYSSGRSAWLLADVERLVEPIPCRGMLGLWTMDEELERRVHQAAKVAV